MKKNVFYLMSMALTIFLFIGVTKTEAQVTIGTNVVPISGALLDLKQKVASPDSTTATKGLMYPRVALKELHELNPMFDGTTTAEVKKEHIGLTVYNVTNNNVFTPGIYVWGGEEWIRPITKLPEVQHTSSNLQQNTTTTVGGPDAKNGEGGIELDFGTIQIPESGFYAFAFRFHGEIDNEAYGTASATYYLSLWKNSSDYAARQDNLKDIVVIDILSFQKTPYFTGLHTYSITMSGYFEKNDMVKIKMANDPNPNLEWVLEGIPTGITAARTSVVWWQL